MVLPSTRVCRGPVISCVWSSETPAPQGGGLGSLLLPILIGVNGLKTNNHHLFGGKKIKDEYLEGLD